jgi:hypothetical protein
MAAVPPKRTVVAQSVASSSVQPGAPPGSASGVRAAVAARSSAPATTSSEQRSAFMSPGTSIYTYLNRERRSVAFGAFRADKWSERSD